MTLNDLERPMRTLAKKDTFYEGHHNKKAVLSQGEPRDAAVNIDTYRILQRHRAVALPQHGFFVCFLTKRLWAFYPTRDTCA